MSKEENQKNIKKQTWEQYAPIIGVVLVVSGLLFLLDQQIKTRWLSLSIPVFISVILLISGIIKKRRLLYIPGYILFGISSALFIIFEKLVQVKTFTLICAGLGLFSLSWYMLFFTYVAFKKDKPWWALFVANISCAVSINFILPELTLLNFLFGISLAIGIVFLAWAICKRQLGLLIPGLIISTIGAGVFFAWGSKTEYNGLINTGTMLVWFALGWILITVFSKIFSKKFVWWPLIPGGVFAMVGSGLYIGGNPGNALGFVQNTGSIGLIMFGVYLILLKFGMNK